ncbi:hypothetical protein JQ604_14835 [Bradyrhizobium jicamae]|uniref:hypothetical protein n=1 Tax=Bradyrhizobium jicamae TaxID=280332 RepID=UPI001BA82F01|nr:hypothetical protein [Bradyrhizobium jicamae]MBR0753461.1 hypothetical protein [Bradyrhizobium jicamae]
MTWREGVEYWRAWARRGDGDIIEDAARIASFYEALLRHNPDLDSQMPPALVSELGMSP